MSAGLAPTAEKERQEFKDQVTKDLNKTTSTLTDRSRVISLGIVALCWAFIIGELPKSGVLKVSLVNLLAPIFLALCSILCDYMQFLFGYFASLNVLRQIENNPGRDVEYNQNAIPYRLRFIMFYVKQGFCFAASVWFLVAILLSLVSLARP